MVCTNILPQTKGVKWICENCDGLLVPITPPVCVNCGAPVESDESQCTTCRRRKRDFSNTAVYLYEDVVRDVIHRFKYYGCPRYAHGLAKLTLDSFPGFFDGAEALVPVPMYPKKRRRRGYNQAEELAAAFSRLTDVPTLYDYLKRVKDTRPQAGLTPAERANNLQGAFALGKKIELKSFILIDDICTTGETLDVCVNLLRQGGAEQIRCLTLAVAVKHEKQQKPEDTEVYE
jgi:ComF family protein